MHFSNYLEVELINATLRGVSYASPSGVYISLLSDLSDDGDTFTEIDDATTNYIRQLANFSEPVSGSGITELDTVIEFPTATEAWGTVTYLGVHDAEASGNLLYWGPLDLSRVVSSGNTFILASGNVTITLD